MVAERLQQRSETVRLIQFSRSPQEGKVKTRMQPLLSAAQACALHCELTLWTCQQLLGSGLGEVELSVAGDPHQRLFERCSAMGVARVTQQRGADLGARMFNAMADALDSVGNVILVGSDCPTIDARYLQQAVAALRQTPVVLGPAVDGGYVLIGARCVSERLFYGMPWGTDQVFSSTCRALQREGMRWTQLPKLQDIDRPSDLPAWRRLQQAAQTR